MSTWPPPLPARFVPVYEQAMKHILANPSMFGGQYDMPRYAWIVAGAGAVAAQQSRMGSATFTNALFKALASPQAQKAVKAVDTEAAKRGMAPGLLGMKPKTPPGVTNAAPPPLNTTPPPQVNTTGDYREYDVGERIWNDGIDGNESVRRVGGWIESDPVSVVEDIGDAATSSVSDAAASEIEAAEAVGAKGLPRWLLPAALGAAFVYVIGGRR